MRSMLKSLLAILITAIIIILIYLGNYYFQGGEHVDSTANSSSESSATANQSNTGDNSKVEEKVQKEEPKEQVVEEKKEEEKKEEKKNEETGNEVVSVNEEDKAIELAKKQYGTTDGVYFRIEQIQSNGVYIVSVRNSETTRDIAWYTVNVNTGVVQ